MNPKFSSIQAEKKLKNRQDACLRQVSRNTISRFTYPVKGVAELSSLLPRTEKRLPPKFKKGDVAVHAKLGKGVVTWVRVNMPGEWPGYWYFFEAESGYKQHVPEYELSAVAPKQAKL